MSPDTGLSTKNGQAPVEEIELVVYIGSDKYKLEWPRVHSQAQPRKAQYLSLRPDYKQAVISLTKCGYSAEDVIVRKITCTAHGFKYFITHDILTSAGSGWWRFYQHFDCKELVDRAGNVLCKFSKAEPPTSQTSREEFFFGERGLS